MSGIQGTCKVFHVDWSRKCRRLVARQLGRRQINTYQFLLRTASNFSMARLKLAANTMRFDLLIVDPLARTNDAPKAVCLGSKGGVGLEFLRMVFENRWPVLAKTKILISTTMPKESVIGQEIIKLGRGRVVWLEKPYKWKDLQKILIELFCRS